MFYSKSTNGFYNKEIHGSNMPSDVVEISIETHQTLLNAQSEGKQITSDNKGFPVAVVPALVALTWELIKAQRDTFLKESDWTDLPNTPLKNKQAWVNYRQNLRDLPQTFGTPEEIVWPQKP